MFDYGTKLREVPILHAQAIGWISLVAGELVGKKLKGSIKSIFELRDEIKKNLEDIDDLFVIIIDDIDRLTPPEIDSSPNF